MGRRRWILVLITGLVLTAGCSTSVPSPEASPAANSKPAAAVNATATTATPHPATQPTVTATVVEVVDGDTLEIRYQNGTLDTVRLIGVDTPEVHAENQPGEFEEVPDTQLGASCLRTWGQHASDYARKHLAGATVRLGFDDRAGRRGYYGRLLAYVYVDGYQFNYALLQGGYARLYDSEFLERQRYAAAEQRAQRADRRVWSCDDSNASTPAAESPLQVRTINADAAGNDNENLNDEYVIFENTGDTALNLSGWTIADAAGHRYRVPADTTLESGATITLHTGTGTDTDTHLYWGRDGAVWNNGGDTITVRNRNGTQVLDTSYE